MLRLVKPKYFFPVHGEYNHLMKHKETSLQAGMKEENVFIMEDGEQWEITPKRVRKVKNVKVGKIYIDNQINEQIENDVVIDRQKLANEGIIMIVAQVDKQNKKLIGRPRVSTYGIIADKDDKIAKIKSMVSKKYQQRKAINIKVLESDLELLKARALKEGMPYQILLNSVLHKYITGQLVDKGRIA